MGFLNDLSKKATETYKNTAEKTNKLTREMKLKSLINEDKSKIEKIYAEIGKKVYENHVREEKIDIESELEDSCKKIDAYSKEIEDMRKEMLSLKGIRLCKVCACEISVTSKFCPKCGALQEEKREELSADNGGTVNTGNDVANTDNGITYTNSTTTNMGNDIINSDNTDTTNNTATNMSNDIVNTDNTATDMSNDIINTDNTDENVVE